MRSFPHSRSPRADIESAARWGFGAGMAFNSAEQMPLGMSVIAEPVSQLGVNTSRSRHAEAVFHAYTQRTTQSSGWFRGGGARSGQAASDDRCWRLLPLRH